MGVNPLWSVALTVIGVFGFWLAGRKVWWCWYVNIACQFLWLAYSLITQQWGFLVGVFIYGFVFIRNAIAWTREHRARSHQSDQIDEEVNDMGFIKRGVGEVLPEQDEQQHKTAADQNWSEQDQRELDDENAKADR